MTRERERERERERGLVLVELANIPQVLGNVFNESWKKKDSKIYYVNIGWFKKRGCPRQRRVFVHEPGKRPWDLLDRSEPTVAANKFGNLSKFLNLKIHFLLWA